MKMKALKAAFPHTIPVMMGYIFLGMAFGILLCSKGYNVLWAVIMSVFIYAGSMQFVAIGLLTGSFNLLVAVLMTIMINARHIFYGLPMLAKFNAMGRKKLYMIFSLTDETFSLLCSAEPSADVDKNWFYFFISLLDQIYWIAGSLIGGIIGSAITFNTKGLDFIMTALFVVIFLEQLKSAENQIPGIIGLLASVLCLIVFGKSNFILPAMFLILAALTIFRKPVEGRKLT